jgi:TatD DNase family protein
MATFDADRAAVIARAWAAGVTQIVNVGFSLESSRASIDLAEKHLHIHATVGVHPHHASAVTPDVIDDLRRLAAHTKVVAVGEIGLDFYRDLSPRDQQQAAFEQQLDLATETGLPVVIHCREAQEEVMATLHSWAERRPLPDRGWRGVLHAFPGDHAMAEAARELGFMVALGGPVTFQNAKRVQALALDLPLDQLLLETDAPYLTPHPYRGQRNEPAHVGLVAEKIAAVRGMTVAELAEKTTANAVQLFGLV